MKASGRWEDILIVFVLKSGIDDNDDDEDDNDDNNDVDLDDAECSIVIASRVCGFRARDNERVSVS